MKRAALGIVSLYQMTLSPLLFRGVCRFQPTCSRYAYEAIERYGIARGTWLGVKRLLLRCQPFGPSGYDPVP